MNLQVRSKFALIGSGASGKSSIAGKAATLIPLKIVDIDDIFVGRYGSISTFGSKNGWRIFFETQGELARVALNSESSCKFPTLIVMPASSLCHEDYPDVCAHTLAVAKEKAHLICVLANRDHNEGAILSVKRQRDRGYEMSPNKKARQYIYQSEFYNSIADRVLINDTTIDEAAFQLCGFIEELKA